MTAFSQLSIQTAIYQALTDDSALMEQVTGIFDRPPQGSAFPYVTIGESVANDWSTKTTSGSEQVFSLHVWSREGGRKETATLMDRLYELLHLGDLNVEEHTLVLLHFVSSGLTLENDGWTYHGIMKFRALLQAD